MRGWEISVLVFYVIVARDSNGGTPRSTPDLLVQQLGSAGTDQQLGRQLGSAVILCMHLPWIQLWIRRRWCAQWHLWRRDGGGLVLSWVSLSRLPYYPSPLVSRRRVVVVVSLSLTHTHTFFILLETCELRKAHRKAGEGGVEIGLEAQVGGSTGLEEEQDWMGTI